MNRHLAIALVLSVIAVALALLSGVHRKGAVLGATSASITGVASLLAMSRTSRSRAATKATQAALAVMSVGFLVRLLLVAIGTILVVRAGESITGFVAAFFIQYFTLAAVEVAYLNSLRRGTGTPA